MPKLGYSNKPTFHMEKIMLIMLGLILKDDKEKALYYSAFSEGFTIIGLAILLMCLTSPAFADLAQEFTPTSVTPKNAVCSLKQGKSGIRINNTAIFEPREDMDAIQSIESCHTVKLNDDYAFLVIRYKALLTNTGYPVEKKFLEVAYFNKEFNRYHAAFSMNIGSMSIDGLDKTPETPVILTWGSTSKNKSLPVLGISANTGVGESGTDYYFYDKDAGSFRPLGD